MSFNTAIQQFESALQIAESTGDSYKEFIAQGLIELSKAIRQEFRTTEQKIETVGSKVNSLR